MRRILMVLAFTCGAALAAAAQTGGDRGGLGSIDANGDGAITRAEAQSARAGLFSQLDADQDGYLNENERTTGQGARLSMDGDQDHDNRLSHDEFMSQPYRVFDRIDVDSDGVLSRAEIEAAQPQH